MFLLSNLNNETYLLASSCILQEFLLLCLSEWFIHSTHQMAVRNSLPGNVSIHRTWAGWLGLFFHLVTRRELLNRSREVIEVFSVSSHLTFGRSDVGAPHLETGVHSSLCLEIRYPNCVPLFQGWQVAYSVLLIEDTTLLFFDQAIFCLDLHAADSLVLMVEDGLESGLFSVVDGVQCQANRQTG